MNWRLHSDKKHYVSDSGVIVPRTSYVLEAAGISDFSFCDKETLEKACIYGEYFHEATFHLDNDNLEYVDPSMQPDIDAWIQFKKDFNVTILDKELLCISMKYRYGCRIDRVLMVRNVKTILDLKTSTTIHRAAALQTASNLEAYNEGRHPADKARNRMVVQFNQDGTYTLPKKDFFSASDFSTFLAALTITNWKGRGH